MPGRGEPLRWKNNAGTGTSAERRQEQPGPGSQEGSGQRSRRPQEPPGTMKEWQQCQGTGHILPRSWAWVPIPVCSNTPALCRCCCQSWPLGRQLPVPREQSWRGQPQALPAGQGSPCGCELLKISSCGEPAAPGSPERGEGGWHVAWAPGCLCGCWPRGLVGRHVARGAERPARPVPGQWCERARGAGEGTGRGLAGHSPVGRVSWYQ